MKKLIIGGVLIALCCMFAGCSSKSAKKAESDDYYALLVDWMTGSFSSAEQAKMDSTYFDIRLEMIPIWEEYDEGAWLYVEQAAAEYLDKPYRQRVYLVEKVDDTNFTSKVFTLPEEERFIGAHKDLSAFKIITPDSLVFREGCTITLKYRNGKFMGSTTGNGCGSSINDAVYATSVVSITENELRSWDRGFNAEGKQVWGAEHGPYIFIRAGTETDDSATNKTEQAGQSSH